MIATLVVDGRYWYDTLTIAWVVAFFLIECLLLFRSSIIGWAMTVKCLVLAGVFFNVLINPPPVLPPEDVSIPNTIIRVSLIVTLGAVIGILIWMRVTHQTVVLNGNFQKESLDASRAYTDTGRRHDHASD